MLAPSQFFGPQYSAYSPIVTTGRDDGLYSPAYMLDPTRMRKMLMRIWKRKMYSSGKLSHFASFSLEKLVATRRKKRAVMITRESEMKNWRDIP